MRNKIEIETILEIYKTYHDSIEKVAEKRQSANTFFLTLNTGILAIIGFLFQKDAPALLKPLYLLLPFVGIISGVFWLKVVNSYRQLNCGKFKVLSEIESHLPIRVYEKEWELLAEGKNPKVYKPLTSIEQWIPTVFIIMYGILSIYFVIVFLIENKVFG